MSHGFTRLEVMYRFWIEASIIRWHIYDQVQLLEDES